MMSKRENIVCFYLTFIVALMARLEIAKEKNKNLKKKYKLTEDKRLERKLAELRFNDFRKLNPPALFPLPTKQLPGPQYYSYNLKGETSLVRFFKQFEEQNEIEEEKRQHPKEEPRYFTKILEKEFGKDEKLKKPSAVPLPEINNDNLLAHLDLKPFNRQEDVQKEIRGK
jgi:hypothetical protein